MSVNTSMTTCVAAYFWVAFATLLFKVVTGMRSLLVDGLFVTVTILVMFLVFASVMKERCGTAPLGAVLNAVLWPWLFMLGGTVAIIHFLPGWIQPFSNTFGYMVCMIPAIGASAKTVALLTGKASVGQLITESPELMLNQFSSYSFDATIQKMLEGGLINTANPNALNDFKRVVVMKDAVAEFVWHLLVGFVAVTTSYNMVMNSDCQKSEFIRVPAAISDNVKNASSFAGNQASAVSGKDVASFSENQMSYDEDTF